MIQTESQSPITSGFDKKSLLKYETMFQTPNTNEFERNYTKTTELTGEITKIF